MTTTATHVPQQRATATTAGPLLADLLTPYRGAVLARPRPHGTALRDRLLALTK